MANGIMTLGSTKSNLEGRVIWESSINSIVDNNSYVAGHLQVRRNDGYTTKGTWTGYLHIGGTTNSFSHSSTSVGPEWVTMLEFSIIKGHNDDGTGSCYFEAVCDAPSGTSLAGHRVSGGTTVTLDTIPRTSSVTCADGNIGSSTTININRASANFTHTLTYSFGTIKGTIVTKTKETSIGWTIPTSFYTMIPNNSVGQGAVFCETYSGDTLIGTTSCFFNAFVINSNPTITATVTDVNSVTTALTGDVNKLVKYFSNAKVTMTATAKNSATIKSQKVTCGGQSKTTATSTIEKVESGAFNLTCTDSRGFVGTNTVTKTMVNYIKLAITSLSIVRESSTSNTVKISLKGNYFNGSFGSVANTLTLKWRYKLQGGTWSGYTTVTATKSGNTFSYSGTLGTTFDYQEAYEFEVVAQDKLMRDPKTRPVTKGTPLVDMWKDNVYVNGRINYNTLNTKTIDANFKTAFRTQTKGDTSTSYGFISTIRNDTANVAEAPQYGSGLAFGRLDTHSYLYTHYTVNTGSHTAIIGGGNGDKLNWVGKIAIPKNLFNNATGSNGTITNLTETVANFAYLEIYYRHGSRLTYKCIKVNEPNGKSFNIDSVVMANETTMQLHTATYSISGTSITYQRAGQVNISSGNTVPSSYVTDNPFYIVRIDGYR